LLNNKELVQRKAVYLKPMFPQKSNKSKGGKGENRVDSPLDVLKEFGEVE